VYGEGNLITHPTVKTDYHPLSERNRYVYVGHVRAQRYSYGAYCQRRRLVSWLFQFNETRG